MLKPLERRQRERYSIEVDVQFIVSKHGKTLQTGSGITRDVSAGGMLFEPNQVLSLDPGNVIHVIAKWPVRYQRTTRVDWIVDGIVVRSDARGIAVEIHKQHLERRAQSRTKKHAG
jgi:c-di-GMP-binding flagellar brake protein YcgR